MIIKRVFSLAVMGLCSISLLCAQAQSQDTIAKNQPETKKVSAIASALQKVTVYGFVRNEVIFNSRMNADFRDGIGAIYPLDRSSMSGLDKNAYSNLSFSAIATRLGVRFDGVQVLGANVSGRLEGDFFGVTNNSLGAGGTWDLFRLRLAYVKLEWAKTSFLAGQDWNPNFLVDCIPSVANFTTGIPFNPYAQVPQLKGTYNFTKKLSIMAMAFMYNLQGFAPTTIANNGILSGNATGVDAQKYSVIPSFALQLTYRSDLILAGIGVESNVLRPMLADSLGTNDIWGGVAKGSVAPALTKVTTLLPTYNLLAYVKFTPKNFVAKIYGNFGQAYTQYVGFGGFATYRDATNGAYKYVAQNQLNLWGEFICTKSSKFQPALFLGYDRNLGLSKKLNTTDYQSGTLNFIGRGISMNRTYQDLFKIAPRMDFIFNNLKMSLEYEWSSMVWGNNDPATFTAKKGSDGDRFTANNHRVSFLVQYNF